MNLIIAKNPKEAVERASEIILRVIKKNPKAVLGLATGKTMIPLYKNLVKLHRKRRVDFSKVTVFNLDEFADLDDNDPISYHYYMQNRFFKKVRIKKEQTHFPSEEGNKYDRQIKKAGGMDLCILGLGRNAHIGFNEPGSSFKSKTREVKLTDETQEVDSKGLHKTVPEYAFTMGLKTIMDARKIMLLAFGEVKAKAVSKALKGPISTDAPASILQKHKDTIFIFDKEAGARL